MTTRPYSELLELVESFAGASLGTAERSRVRAYVNRRAKKAYRATNYWPRFLVVGEERITDADGLIPFTESNKTSIDTFLAIHATRPHFRAFAREYEFFVTGDGAQIINYTLANHSLIDSITLSGDATASVNVDGDGNPINQWALAGTYLKAPTQVDGKDVYSTDGLDDISDVSGVGLRFYYDGGDGWTIDAQLPGTGVESAIYREGFDSDVSSPVDALFSSNASGNQGSFELTAGPTYAAYCTYKAAHSDLYGTNDGDETEVPEEWFDYLAYGAYSDFLRGDGQTEKAIAEDMAAQDVLSDQLEKISSMHIASQVAQRIRTHASHQSR